MRLSLCLLACAAAPALSACVMLNGESAKAPDQVVADSQAAVRSAQSYRVSIDVHEGGDAAAFDLAVAGSRLVQGRLTVGGATGDIVVVSDRVYLRGGDLLSRLGDAGAAPSGDDWVETTEAAAPDVVKVLAPFIDPTSMADCVLGEHGTLTATQGTFDGASVVELHDAGDVPGTAPATLAIAGTGTPYPLHLSVTGPPQLGTVDLPAACETSATIATSSSASSASAPTIEATFEDWGAPVTVTRPAGAVAPAPFGAA